MILHADKFRPTVLLSAKLHLGELVGVHGRRADVADFAAADEVVESAHGLFDGGVGVEAVDLEEVHVVQVHALEGGVDGFEDGGAGEAWEVDMLGVWWEGEGERMVYLRG